MKILFVCLGNICRSPTAEGVMRACLQSMPAAERKAMGDIELDSAGTAGYHIGEPPDRRSQRAARARGIDIADLRARKVSRADFSHFDLILAMDESNLEDLKAMQPKDSQAKLGLFMDYAQGAPGRAVPDPYELDGKAFDHVLDLCALAAQGLISTLRPSIRYPR